MEIKRKVEMFVATSRRFVIHGSSSGGTIFCAECGGATLTAEQCAKFFGITQRALFQLIESGSAHFAEIETGAVMICLPTLAAVLQISDGKQIAPSANQPISGE